MPTPIRNAGIAKILRPKRLPIVKDLTGLSVADLHNSAWLDLAEEQNQLSQDSPLAAARLARVIAVAFTWLQSFQLTSWLVSGTSTVRRKADLF
jgi:hypothetical protein